MKGSLSDVIGIIGIAFMIGPWYLLDEANTLTFFLVIVGAVLAGISRADALSDLLKRGNPGDEFLKDSIRKIRSVFRKR